MRNYYCHPGEKLKSIIKDALVRSTGYSEHAVAPITDFYTIQYMSGRLYLNLFCSKYNANINIISEEEFIDILYLDILKEHVIHPDYDFQIKYIVKEFLSNG